MTVDALDRLRQLALGVRLMKATDRNSGSTRIRMPGSEESRDAARFCGIGELNPCLLPAQADVAQDQVDPLVLDNLQGIVELVDGGDNLVAGVAKDILVVERGQRLILNDEDPLDDLLALPEQHLDPNDPATATNQAQTSAAPLAWRAPCHVSGGVGTRRRLTAGCQAPRPRRSRVPPRDRTHDRRRAHCAQRRKADDPGDTAGKPGRHYS